MARITQDDIRRIVAIIETYPGRKLTWEKLAEISGVSRPTLTSIKDVRDAFEARKTGAGARSPTAQEGELASLKRRVASAERDNHVLREQISRYQINAVLGDLSLQELEQDLPSVHAERSDRRDLEARRLEQDKAAKAAARAAGKRASKKPVREPPWAAKVREGVRAAQAAGGDAHRQISGPAA